MATGKGRRKEERIGRGCGREGGCKGAREVKEEEEGGADVGLKVEGGLRFRGERSWQSGKAKEVEEEKLMERE